MAQLDEARTISDTVAAHVSDHNQLHTKANYVFDVKDYGAVGDGSTDDSTAIQSAMTAATGTVCYMPPGTYRANSLSLPANTELSAEGVTIERHATSSDAVVAAAGGSYIHGLTISGRNTTLTGASGESGLYVTGDATIVERVTSSLNYHHGIRMSGDDGWIDKCTSFSNGENGDTAGNGTGDGIYILNGDNVRITNCWTYLNDRTGIVATTFDGGGTDETLSTGLICSGCFSELNVYNDVNFEGVSFAQITDLRCPSDTGDLIFSTSDDMTISNYQGASLYAQNSDRVTVNGVEIRTTDTATAFFVAGLRPQIDNVRIVGSGAQTSNAFEVVDTTDYSGMVANISVDTCNNGVVLNGVSEVKNIHTDNVGNVNWRVGRAGGTGTTSIYLDNMVESKLTVYDDAAPSTGWWDRGDRAYDRSPTAGSTMGWVCTTAGSPGTWKTFGAITA